MAVLCFFVKQKTEYEMSISDWSSDVCASDLLSGVDTDGIEQRRGPRRALVACGVCARRQVGGEQFERFGDREYALRPHPVQIGSAPRRDIVCQYVSLSGFTVSFITYRR